MAIITLNNNSLSAITGLPAGVGGKVLQVVQGTSSTEFTQSSPSNSVVYYPSSNKLSASITPSSTSSKILIQYISTARGDHTTNTDVAFALAVKESISGGSTTEIKPDADTFGSGFYNSNVDNGSAYRVRLSDVVYRAPSTTSAITYEVGVSGYNSTSIRLNADSSRGEIILMEIAG
jgi:hypothetical protein